MVDVDILSVIDPLLRGNKTGSGEYTAICPFHVKEDGTRERSPSFSVNLTTGLFFCHSCHMSGGLRTLLRNLEVSPWLIVNAYEPLIRAANANIGSEVKACNPLRPKAFDANPITEGLLGLFDSDVTSLLPSFREDALKFFDVGWDSTHRRITYPIRDLKGDLTAISGRAVDDDNKPRYKVYDKEYQAWGLPNREGWLKGTVIWNSHNVLPLTKMSKPGESWIVVVEGFKAAMHVWQCGYPNVVALLGSHLTEDQRWILEHFGARVLLFLDNNSPGRVGQFHTGTVLSEALSVWVIEYPERLKGVDGAQPDMLSLEEVWQQVANPISFNQWFLDNPQFRKQHKWH